MVTQTKSDLVKTTSDVVKTESEMNLMKISGKICAIALKKVLERVKPGISCLKLDEVAKRQIKEHNASSSFMTVEGYKWTICTTLNDQVVHGIPSPTKLKEGDILGIDIGALYKGFHSDMAITVPVGHISEDAKKFLASGRQALEKAISQARVGNRIGDIASTIEDLVESAGYSIVKSLTGHGIGRQLHEEPLVPGFGQRGTGPQILENMVLAIEVIYAKGSSDVKLEKDGWTISTKDKTLGGLFEQTVAITRSGPIVLTPYL